MVGQESPSFPMTVAANAVVFNETTVKVFPSCPNIIFHTGSEQVSTNVRLSCGNISGRIICYKMKQEALQSVQCTSKYVMQYNLIFGVNLENF